MVYIALFWILSTFYEEVYNQVDLVYIYIYMVYMVLVVLVTKKDIEKKWHIHVYNNSNYKCLI